jgi:uncharacterized membrane protein (UPF0127 family)
MQLINKRTGMAVASVVEIAVTRTDRRRGLLGRDALDLSAAVMLAPCAAVHTGFMRFTIDVVFVDRDGSVRKIVRNLVPWRIAASPRAYAAIELASGIERDLVPGDRLYLAGRGSDSGTADLRSASPEALVTLRRTASNPAWAGS